MQRAYRKVTNITSCFGMNEKGEWWRSFFPVVNWAESNLVIDWVLALVKVEFEKAGIKLSRVRVNDTKLVEWFNQGRSSSVYFCFGSIFVWVRYTRNTDPQTALWNRPTCPTNKKKTKKSRLFLRRKTMTGGMLINSK